MRNKYGFGKVVSYSFSEANKRVRKELEKEGFGVLTQIDVAATLKSKLDQDMPPYLILGACNPQFAHRALEADSSIGLLLPCNVVIREDKQKNVCVEIMDPVTISLLANNPEIDSIATEVQHKLERILKAI